MNANTSTQYSWTLETARELTAQGLFVVPVPFKSKKPYVKDWPNLRLSQSELPKHFGNRSNIGLLLGVGPQFIADVDLDSNEAIAAARLISGPETHRISGRKGKKTSHYFFSLLQGTATRTFETPDGNMILEIRGIGHQTIVPPSVHPCGEPSEWERDQSFGKSTEAEVTKWGVRVASAALLAKYWPTKGCRHLGVLALSGILARSGWTQGAAVEFVLAAAQVAGDEEWQDRECDVRSTFTKVERGQATTGAPRAKDYFLDDVIKLVCEWLELTNLPIMVEENIYFSQCTDVMNANRFASQHSNSLRFCSEQNTWYAWTGTRWRSNEIGEATRCASDTARSIYREAQCEKNDTKRVELAKWAIRSESRQRIDATVALARFHRDIEVHSYAETFDRYPWLLNCENGIVDLCTGTLGPHRSDALITRIAPVPYDPEAVCPRWERFIAEVMCGNSDLVSYLHRVVGYTLTGCTRERVLFLLFGDGNNGKTIFVRGIASVLGDYAHCVPFQEFIQKKHDGGSNEIAQLQGARFVYSTEAPVDRAFNEALLKQLSGGDKIRARALYRESSEWDSQGKLFFAANHRPAIRETADAIWNRVQSIPFLAFFKDESCDKELLAKLQTELPGILAWAVRGCLAWQSVGLRPPTEVIAANRDYRAENDTLSDFLSDRCEQNPKAHVLVAELYADYSEWARQNGCYVMKKRSIGVELGRRGFKKAAYNGKDAWRGIGLLTRKVD